VSASRKSPNLRRSRSFFRVAARDDPEKPRRDLLLIESEGLEWETPDRYREEIRDQGFEEWKRKYQTASEWRKRNKMLRDFIESSFMS